MNKTKNFLGDVENLLKGFLGVVQDYKAQSDSGQTDEQPSINAELVKQEPAVTKSVDENEKPLSFKEMIDFLGIAESTGYQRIGRGEIPHFKVGGRLYFKRLELMKYIEGGRRETADEIDEIAEKHLRNFENRK